MFLLAAFIPGFMPFSLNDLQGEGRFLELPLISPLQQDLLQAI
jgi:hypothetical protein